MARPKTEFRNEMKSRVPDRVYEGVKMFQVENGFDSESRAISHLLELALYGHVGIVPQPYFDNRNELAQSGPVIRA